MTCAFLQNEEGGIYNIGSGVASTWNDLARAVFEAMDRELQIEYIDMPSELINKYQNYSCADMVKTQQVLKEETRCMDLKDAVSDYVRNYLLPGKTW
jgi:ADP-L-glycero-D-manno-heptose 6-epimerase